MYIYIYISMYCFQALDIKLKRRKNQEIAFCLSFLHILKGRVS